jgi:Alpha/beta hydrolase family
MKSCARDFRTVYGSTTAYTVARHLSDHRAPYSVEELSKIRVPALFVWCREDGITPLKWGEDFAAAVSGPRLAVIDGCGHLPNLEKPPDFNRSVLEFLDARQTAPSRWRRRVRYLIRPSAVSASCSAAASFGDPRFTSSRNVVTNCT